MVYTYEKVIEIKKKLEKDEEIDTEEIQKLSEYIDHKKQVASMPRAEWPRKQLANAEMLLHKINSEKQKITAGE